MIKPLNPSVAAIWEHDSSDYADLIKVPMEDGKVITYRREIRQPEPILERSIDLIRIMNKCVYGGSYKGKHEQNDRELIAAAARPED